MKSVLKLQGLQMFAYKKNPDVSHFQSQPWHGDETQFQVGEKLKKKTLSG